MGLSRHRISQGDTSYSYERDAISFVEGELPDTNPFYAWELVELHDASTGRLYEIDLIVLGYSALYLVEIKSGPGTYKGDSVDWTRNVPGERPRSMDCPYRLANTKAKILGSLLQRKLDKRAPWVQPIIFLSHPDAKLDLRPDGLTGVVTRAKVKAALTHHDFPNRDPRWRVEPVREPVMRDVVQAFPQIGIRPRKGRLRAGSYDLGALIDEGEAYQDRVAVHQTTASIERRARTYLVPQQTSVERRQALRRAADREAQLLHELRDHAGILRLNDYVEDAPLGPTVLFEPFDKGVRLDAFVRQTDGLTLGDRVEIVAQVGRALAFCHRKEIFHGGICPESVLVRRGAAGLEVRLFNFQLASAGDRVEGTSHASAWTSQPMLVYRAPELRENPAAWSRQSDIFSLGALGYFVLTGQAPAVDVSAVDERLRTVGWLDPRVADDRIPPGVADVIQNATAVSWAERYDDADEWVALLEEYATAPALPAHAPHVDPLHAGKDDRIRDDLEVVSILGQGASARVLHVRRLPDGADFALKVSLSPEHDDRIRAEGDALKKFRHARIVTLIDAFDLGGHACLLLALAGTDTLQRHLQKEGPVLLDYALRWGEDLLGAVEYLEEEGITHRDIKPANLGIGTVGKKANHLTLFDFSLVLADERTLDAGTAAYRDPFLRGRGTWDAAADRWSAAVTLHEMLTGVRPTFGGAFTSSVDPAATLTLAADRFDPSIRDRLVRFFDKALARDAAARFPQAGAMRRAWTACFAEASVHPVGEAPAPSADAPEDEPKAAPPVVTDDEIRRIAADAPIDALPLSIRARNALDRAGITRARQLVKLPNNLISAIRGVGRSVVKEISDFRDRWQALRTDSDVPVAPFFDGYRGENVAVAPALPADVAAVLDRAGLATFAAVAAAAEEQVVRLAAKNGFAVATLRDALTREHEGAAEREHPATIEGWCEALFPAKKRGTMAATPPAVRVLLGLQSPGVGKDRLPIGASVNDAAPAHGTSTANVYLGLGRAREAWSAHPGIGQLVSEAQAIVEASGGAVSLGEAAGHLIARIPHDRARSDEDAKPCAAALLRAAAEVEHRAAEPRFVAARVNDTLWLCASNAHAAAVRELGKTADELATRTPLAAAPETHAALQAAAAGTPLATLPLDRLTPLAASASTIAACSTRFEMYPRGMAADRAIELTASMLTGNLTADDVKKRVRDRYPEAAPLPDDLDDLLRAYGLVWNGKEFHRPNDDTRTTLSTRHTTPTRLGSSLPRDARGTSTDANDVDDRIANAIDRKQLRVLLVRSDLVARALPRLHARVGAKVERVDRLLLAAMKRRAEDDGIDLDVVHEAHTAGRAQRADWDNLVSLARDALDDVLAARLPARAPLVLSHLGLIGQYGLQRFYDRIAEASQRDDCAAIFLVVPAHDEAAAVALEGVTLPGLLPSHRLWLTRAWIDRAAAA